ncbi:Protein CBG15943 [Caenorhabditis briggsae]|uniref:Protein CBG15943 n=1 Tax=Caenorhabditis briggsae TaxID=6238 RepID=A8XNF3_CAEBR|nr:Protein CBG15943 [Caenorhabditis briggsae]CAP34384.1 Protein CBG15943 [Caenorhabditis briggsae]
MAWLGEDDMGYTSPAVPRRDVKWYLLEDTDNRVKWFTGILVVVSVGMLIAGSVMLGIGISKNNSNPPPPVNLNASGYTMFLNVRTKDLPYSAVLNDYSGSVKNLTEQMRQAISPSRASEFTVQPDVPITILGISNAGQWADVMYALSYIESTKPSISDIQKQVTNSEAFSMISAIDQTPPALTQMTCASVADAMLTTVSPAVPTSTPAPNTSPKGSTAASSSFGTVAPATGSTVTQPTVTTTTKPAPVTITTVTTPPVTRPTELARTTTTPFVKTPFSMDVIILLDDSKAMQTAKNFNQVKSWLDSTLLPLWLIDREDVQVAFATYADTEFNTLLDFDEANEKEVTDVISAQMYSGKFNSSITNGIRAAGDIHGLRPVNQTVILISASEDLTDIESATQYAYILNTLPKQLITITLNSATSGKQLGLLSTNQNHYFGVADFNLTSDIAQQLTQVMFGSLTPSTVLPPTPTPSAIPDNACKTDVTILVDNTNDVGSIDEFQNQVRTISKLIKTWPISPEVMEGEAVVFGTKEGGQIIENAFKYQTASAFAKEVMAFDDLYFPNSSPSLTASLQYLAQNLGIEERIASRPHWCSLIQGNVIYVKNMTTDIIDQVNSLLCSPSTRAPLITIPTTVTNKPTITTVVSTQPPSTTQPPPTTPKPDFCPDCYPKTSNILIMFEASGVTLTSQKKLVDTDLITNWTHFERTSVMGFATNKKFVDPLPFNGVENKDDFVSIVDNAIIDLAVKPTIVAAFTMATNQANPLQSFGRMNTVIFTSGATDDEINSSVAMSSMLRYNGKVILVGLKLTDTTGLNSLCDVLINWEDFTSTATVAAQINQALNS